MLQRILSLFPVLCLLLTTACSTLENGGGGSAPVRPAGSTASHKGAGTTHGKEGAAQVAVPGSALSGKTLAKQAAAGLLAKVKLAGKPVLFVDGIRNQTADEVDTGQMDDVLRRALLASGRYQLVDNASVDALGSQLEYQQGGDVSPAALVRLGKQAGARYMLYGYLDKPKSRLRLSMTLLDLQSGEVVWQQHLNAARH